MLRLLDFYVFYFSAGYDIQKIRKLFLNHRPIYLSGTPVTLHFVIEKRGGPRDKYQAG